MKEEISPKGSQITNDQAWAERVEKILRQWLLEQPYSMKLAFVLLNGCRLADDCTQAVFHEISEQYKAEVINAAEELPGTLVNIEVFLTGVAADMLHSEDRLYGPLKKDKSDKADIAKPASKSDEKASEPKPFDKGNSSNSGNAKSTSEFDKGNLESTSS